MDNRKKPGMVIPSEKISGYWTFTCFHNGNEYNAENDLGYAPVSKATVAKTLMRVECEIEEYVEVQLYEVSSEPLVYASKSGFHSVQLTDAAQWGYYQDGQFIDSSFQLDKILEKHNLSI